MLLFSMVFTSSCAAESIDNRVKLSCLLGKTWDAMFFTDSVLGKDAVK